MKMRMIFIVVMGRDRLSTGEMASRPLSVLLPVLAFACLLGCKGNGGVSGAGGTRAPPARRARRQRVRRRRGRVLARRAAGRVRDLRRESGPRLSREGGGPRCRRFRLRGDAGRDDARCRAPGIQGCARQLAGAGSDPVRAHRVAWWSRAAKGSAATSTTGRTWTAVPSSRTSSRAPTSRSRRWFPGTGAWDRSSTCCSTRAWTPRAPGWRAGRPWAPTRSTRASVPTPPPSRGTC